MDDYEPTQGVGAGKERLESMIAELSQIQPKYAYNSKDFIPGKTPV